MWTLSSGLLLCTCVGSMTSFLRTFQAVFQSTCTFDFTTDGAEGTQSPYSRTRPLAYLVDDAHLAVTSPVGDLHLPDSPW